MQRRPIASANGLGRFDRGWSWVAVERGGGLWLGSLPSGTIVVASCDPRPLDVDVPLALVGTTTGKEH